MKARKMLIMLAVVPLLVSGCQAIKDAITVKEDVSFTVSLPVTVPESGLKSTPVAFTATEVFDPMTNTTVQEYAEQIKSFALTSLTLQVTNISDPPVVLTNTLLNISATVGGANLSVNLDADKTWNNGDTKTIGTGDWATIESMLDALVPITCTVIGFCDKPGVSFSVDAVLASEVTVRILN